MNDKTLRRKLKEFVDLGNELDAEAKRRYGREGLLFHEADGQACIMGCLPEEGNKNKHIRFSESGVNWGAGAF